MGSLLGDEGVYNFTSIKKNIESKAYWMRVTAPLCSK